MKFHNQRSFMGHEISNVNNKPLLRKKGKQWIVVAVSALILAGFGGMVSTTTHADTTNAQPTTTKVASKPANTSSAKPAAPKVTQPNTNNIGQQATDLHKNLVNNSINNSNNNSKPKITTLGLSSPATLRTNPTIQRQGNWTNSTATWTLDNQGNLVVHGHGSSESVLNHSSDNGHDLAEELGLVGNKTTTQSVKTLSFDGNVSAPYDAHRLFDDEEFDNNGTNLNSYDFSNLHQINLRGLDISHTNTYWAMFGGLKGLTNVIGLENLPSSADVEWLFCDDPSLTSVNLGNVKNMPSDHWTFFNDSKLNTIILGPNIKIDKKAFIDNESNPVPSSQNEWTDMYGNHVTLSNNSNNTLYDASTNGNNDTWTVGNNKPSRTITDTIIYINKENGNQVNCNSAYYSGNVGLLTGVYGKYVTSINPSPTKSIWYQYSDVNGQPGTGNNMPGNWNIVPGSSDRLNKIEFDGGTYKVDILPNQVTDTVNYSDGSQHIASKQFTGDISSAAGANNTGYDAGAPAGYYATSNTQFSYGASDETKHVKVASDEDYLDYRIYNDPNSVLKQSGPITFKTNSDNITNNNRNNFTISKNYNNNIPSGYHIVGGDGISTTDNNNNESPINDKLIFNHQNGHHAVYVAPNTVTINYKDNNKVVSSNTATFDGNSKDISAHVSNYYHIPAGYQLVNGQSNNTLSFDNDNNSVTVQVTPKQATDTIDYIANYPNGSTLVSSASSTGNDYQAQGATNTQFTVTSAPANYQLVPNENTTFNYDSSNHDVAVEPAQNNQKTDVINYMNGDVKIASDVYTGNDMYAPNANHTSFNANDYVPAGYHVVNDGGNTFYFDGQTHDVTVYPNSITLEFNNGQAGSKTINNLKGTTYQINSSDVPANYQLTNPSDTNVDLGKLGNSTDYNVDVSPIQQPVTPTTPSASDNVQPSVPYIPSMPASSATSVSSASSEPVASASASSTTSQPSNEAQPIRHYYRSHYSHYRYAKVITPLQLHTSKHFTDKNGVLVIKHPTEFRIMKIVHDHKYTRYEVKYQGHKYFITGNSKFTINDYVQKHDFKSHKHMMVRVITPLIEYKHAHFSRKYAIRVFKKGAVLPVKRVFTIGKGEMTRFELTNGRYVTSNKLFVKVIK